MYLRRISKTIRTMVAVVLLSSMVVSVPAAQGAKPPPPAAPTLSGINPTAAWPGSSVTLTGSGFGPKRSGDAVTFAGGIDAVAYTLWSDTQIVCTVPTGAQQGDVVVQVDKAVSNGSYFTPWITPVITSLSPSTGVVGSTLTIDGTGFGATPASITVSGATAAVSSWTDARIVATVPDVVDGDVVVSVSGHPSAGAAFDVLSPTVDISGVTEGGVYPGPVTPVVSVIGAATQLITLNGASWTPGEISAAGSYELRVEASCAAGTTTVVRNFTIDTTGPSIDITGVVDGGLYNAPITPVITVTDATSQSITLDGAPWTPGEISAEGAHTLVVQAADDAGHVAQASVMFTIDTTGPTIDISGVVEGGLYNAAISPTVTVSGAATSTITLNGVSWAPGTVDVEGSYLLSVTASDSAGNSSARTLAFAIDLTGPTVEITGVSPGGIYNTAVSPSVTITGADSSSITLNGTPWTPAEITEDGDYTLAVGASDAAGNAVSQSVAFTIDRTAPAISIAGVTDGSLYNTAVTPAVTVTGADVSSVMLDGAPWTPTEITADGTYTLAVSASDGAGNSASQTITFEIDRTAPVIDITGVTDGSVCTAAVTPVVTVTGATSQSITLNGDSWTPAEISADGAYVLAVNATDDAGNTSATSVSFTVDTSGPTITITGVSDGGLYTTAVTPVVTVTGATSQSIILNGTPWAPAEIAADGAYTLVVSAVDDAGNSSLTSVMFLIDTVGPGLEISGVEQGGLYNVPVTPVVSITGADSSSITLNGAAWSPVEIASDGVYTLDVEAADDAGNTAAVSITFEIDRTAPIIDITGVVDGGLYDAAVTPAVSVNGASAYAITLNGAPWTPGEITADGSYSLVVTAVDLAGNSVLSSVTFAVDTTIEPIISSLSTSTAEYDSVITVYGSHFGLVQGPLSNVTFNGVAATVLAWTDNAIELIVPGSGPVVVNANNLASNEMPFDAFRRPRIDSVSPDSALPATVVTLRGAYFGDVQGTSAVSLSGYSVDITDWSDTLIVATVPYAPAGASQITVTVGGHASSPAPFAVLAPRHPVVTGLSASQGAPGTLVTISGSDFGDEQGIGWVTFAGTPGIVRSWSDTAVVAEVPDDAHAGYVGVVQDTNTSNGIYFVPFNYPQVVSVSPVTVNAGKVVTITGTNFGSIADKVVVAGVAITPQSWSDTQVTFVVPTTAVSGYVGIKRDSVTSNGKYVTITPRIDTVPNWSPPGSTLTIGGAGFGTGSDGKVMLGSRQLTTSSWTSTQIQANIPADAVSGQLVVMRGTLSSNSKYLVVNKPATITAVDSNRILPGQTLVVTGRDFGTPSVKSSIKIGTLACTDIQSWTDTQITLCVPTGVQAGYLGVYKEGLSSNGIWMVVAPPFPKVTALSSWWGVPGTQVTITGNFFGDTQGSGYPVFAGVRAQVVSWSNTSVVAIVPEGTVTGYAGIVQNGFTSNGMFFMPYLPPRIDAVSTSTAGPGDVVTVTGSGFRNTPGRLTVGGVTVTAQSWSENAIEFVVPAGLASGYIGVTQDGKVSNGVWLGITP